MALGGKEKSRPSLEHRLDLIVPKYKSLVQLVSLVKQFAQFVTRETEEPLETSRHINRGRSVLIF